MSTTIFHEYATLTLEVVRCWSCGIRFAIEQEHKERLERKAETLYCPRGCKLCWVSETEETKLRKQIVAKQAALDQARAEIDSQREMRHQVERRLVATKGVVTRTKRRVGNGVCPCCKRSFSALAAHMKTKHPEYGEKT